MLALHCFFYAHPSQIVQIVTLDGLWQKNAVDEICGVAWVGDSRGGLEPDELVAAAVGVEREEGESEAEARRRSERREVLEWDGDAVDGGLGRIVPQDFRLRELIVEESAAVFGRGDIAEGDRCSACEGGDEIVVVFREALNFLQKFESRVLAGVRGVLDGVGGEASCGRLLV